jgi:hypothetical protein
MKNPIPNEVPFFLNEVARAIYADCRDAVDAAIEAEDRAKKKREYHGARAWRDRKNAD